MFVRQNLIIAEYIGLAHCDLKVHRVRGDGADKFVRYYVLELDSPVTNLYEKSASEGKTHTVTKVRG